jgi:hypothetical protein
MTFSFGKLKPNERFDIDACRLAMKQWLDNQQKTHKEKGYKKFKYVIVMELHKRCKQCSDNRVKLPPAAVSCPHPERPKAPHFHMLARGYKGKLTLAKKKVNGRKTYNINSYRHGHNTYLDVDNIAKVASYIKKYITKEMPHFANKNRYWCSQGLVRPIVEEWDGYSLNNGKAYQTTIWTPDDAPRLRTNGTFRPPGNLESIITVEIPDNPEYIKKRVERTKVETLLKRLRLPREFIKNVSIKEHERVFVDGTEVTYQLNSDK